MKNDQDREIASKIARLQASTDTYLNMIELSSIGLTTLDMKGVIKSCNSVIYDKGGYTADELIGEHFSHITPIRVSDILDLYRYSIQF